MNWVYCKLEFFPENFEVSKDYRVIADNFSVAFFHYLPDKKVEEKVSTNPNAHRIYQANIQVASRQVNPIYVSLK